MKYLKSLFLYIFHVIVIFGFLFEINLVGPLTTRRIALVLAILELFFLKQREFVDFYKYSRNQKLRSATSLFAICTLIALINTPSVKHATYDYLEWHYFLYIFLYIYVFALYVVTAFKDARSLFNVYITVFAIQAVAVFIASTNDAFRWLLFESTIYDERFVSTVDNGSRMVGIGLSSSSGSIVCSTACVLLSYLMIKRKISVVLFAICSIVMILITFFIGRTGILVEFIVLGYAVLMGKNLKKLLPYFIIAILVTPFLLTNLLDNMTQGEYLKDWMFSIFDPEKRKDTMENIFQSYPTFGSGDYILGTGIVRGHAPNGDNIQVDSGYINMYTSIGIIGSICYYLAFLKLYSFPIRKRLEKYNKLFFKLLILVSFIIEYKEPYMMKYIFPFTILTLILFEIKEENNNLHLNKKYRVR